MILRHWKVNFKENFIFKKKKKGWKYENNILSLSIIIIKRNMTQTLELTAAELELIENKRKQDILAEEAEKLKKEAKIQKESIEMETAIRKEQNNCNDQVIATKAYLKELQKLNPNYKLVEQDKELSRHIWGEYLPWGNNNHEREILKEFKYTLTQAHIILDGTPFKVEVKKHMVYSGWRSSTDKGYKMELYGGGFYNERLLSNPKTLNKKIEDKLESIENKKVAEQKKASSLDTAYDNLVNKYPDATITKSTEWERNSYDRKVSGETINIITVTLLNKIKIKFKVYSDGTLGRKEISYPFKNNLDLLDTLNNIIIPEVTN